MKDEDKRIIETLKLPTENYVCPKCGRDFIIREGIRFKCYCGKEKEIKQEEPTNNFILD